ncbi:MAG: Fe(3+) ABC transporter substrate-binding protein, partial [Pelagibacteraceae bacterium]|nr:Fe(3+) ABC transporter substrate-binding protein [Pelagibacteraceae bacterium]
MLNSKNEKDRKTAEKVSVFWPNQETFGTHINLSG